MTRTLIFAAAAAAGLAVAATPAAAQRWNDHGWRTIAIKTVNGRNTDIIALPGRTRQSAIRVCSLTAPLRLIDFDVRFDNGRTQDANTRAVLGVGRCTRAIDLRGNRRDIDRIRLRYEPVARRARHPVVRVQVR